MSRNARQPRAGIEITRGVRVDKPFAVDAHDGRGGMTRESFGTASEARRVAKRLAEATKWPLSDKL